MDDERPILEVRQSAWQLSSVRDQRLRIFGDRVELVRPKVTSEARTTTIPFADIDYISVKPFLLAWFDLVIVPKSGAAIRLKPLARSDAEHAEELISIARCRNGNPEPTRGWRPDAGRACTCISRRLAQPQVARVAQGRPS